MWVTCTLNYLMLLREIYATHLNQIHTQHTDELKVKWVILYNLPFRFYTIPNQTAGFIVEIGNKVKNTLIIMFIWKCKQQKKWTRQETRRGYLENLLKASVIRAMETNKAGTNRVQKDKNTNVQTLRSRKRPTHTRIMDL